MSEPFITVVAAALGDMQGRWLMHRRPPGKHHGGLWEFPGGKVERLEMPAEALMRELAEELGIACRAEHCRPAGFAETDPAAGGRRIVILLYSLTRWEGEPRSLEGGAVGWFTPAQILALDKPPLDIALAGRLFDEV